MTREPQSGSSGVVKPMKRGPLHAAGLAVSLAMASLPVAAEETSTMSSATTQAGKSAATLPGRHLGTDDTIGDLLCHPALEGFAPLVLPWDDRATDPRMRLDRIAGLLPYHSQVRPAVVVAGLNRMIDDVAAGHQVFFDIYSQEEKARDPSRARAGLFFFRGPPGAPFAMIAPGGGFAYVGSVHEGFPYATEINTCGYNAFIIRYRAGAGGKVATEDMAAAVSFVLRNANTLGVATEGYSLWGSSAGARMAASIGSHGVAAFGGDKVGGPAAVIMAYTAHSDHAAVEPPTFAVVGEDDGIAPPASMRRRIEALRKIGTRTQYVEYPRVGHGFGTGAGTSAQGWIERACDFWKEQLALSGGKATR